MHGRLAAATTPQWSRPVAWPTSGYCPWPRLEGDVGDACGAIHACTARNKSDGHCQGHIQVHLLVTVTNGAAEDSDGRSVLSFNGRMIAGFQYA